MQQHNNLAETRVAIASLGTGHGRVPYEGYAGENIQKVRTPSLGVDCSHKPSKTVLVRFALFNRSILAGR